MYDGVLPCAGGFRVALPTEVKKFTVLKSPHIYKKHRVQYEMKTHARLVQVGASLHGSTPVLMRCRRAVATFIFVDTENFVNGIVLSMNLAYGKICYFLNDNYVCGFVCNVWCYQSWCCACIASWSFVTLQHCHCLR